MRLEDILYMAPSFLDKTRATYPYELNIDLVDGMRKKSEVMVGRNYSSLNRTVCCQSRGTKHKTPNQMNGARFLDKLN